MAQKVTTTLVDDLDGGEAIETIQFELDGSSYEIDLSGANAEKLRQTIGSYTLVARKVPRNRTGGGTVARRRGGGPKSSNLSPGERQRARHWARQHGFQVAVRGALSAEVLTAYRRAHGQSA